MKTETTAEPQEGQESPWSIIQGRTEWAPGVIFVSTAGHGGFWISPEHLEKIPARWRAFAAKWSHGWGEQWYEEDVAAIAVGAYVLKDATALEILPRVEAQSLPAVEVKS